MGEKTLDVENLEHNVAMLYEAKRKELEILLTSSIPQQLANMKTLLWVNMIMIGLMLHFIKNFPLPDTIIGFFLFSVTSTLCVLFAMLTNRYKSYGVPNDIFQMNKYEDDEWTISQATLDLMGTVQISIEGNRKVITNRGKLMHLSTWFTLCAIIFIVISFSIKQTL